jgi:hypothetical protein
MNKKRYAKVLLCCILIFTLPLLTACNKVDQREKEVVQLVAIGAYDRAIRSAEKSYKGKELDEMIYWINSKKPNTTKAQAQTKKLEIQSEYTDKVKGDYIYITGRVKNISDTNISYFEVRCDFLDDDKKVLDSDYTNNGLTLKSGEMREFEIMHKYSNKYKNYKLSIGDVK